MEKIDDILKEMRDPDRYPDFSFKAYVELCRIADRIESAWEMGLAVEKARAAAEGYAEGQRDMGKANKKERTKIVMY